MLQRVFLIVLLGLNPAFAGDSLELAPNRPDRYVVVEGDTLWDIASRFLSNPWRWPTVWNKNQQIENPHLIFPGDVIVLNYVNGVPELSVLRGQKLTPDSMTPVTPAAHTSSGGVSGAVKLNPQVRSGTLESAIPTLKPEVIAPFLTQPLVVDRRGLNKAGYVTIGLDNRLALGDLSQFYARGLGRAPSDQYQIFRPGKALRHPDTREILGYEALYLGDARLLEGGDPAKLEVTKVMQEILPTDRLVRAPERVPLPYYYPRAPDQQVYGRILTTLNGVAEMGPGSVVALSLGRREGMEEGHVLRIMRHAGKHVDPVTRRNYKLPDEESGLLIVFRTFEKVSYALIVNANRPIHIHDAVKNP